MISGFILSIPLSLAVTSTTNTIDVNLGVTDAGSGLDKVKITLYKIGANADGTDKLIKSYEGTAYSFTGLTSNTEYRVVLEAWDKAGNLTQDSKEISF